MKSTENPKPLKRFLPFFKCKHDHHSDNHDLLGFLLGLKDLLVLLITQVQTNAL